MIQTEREEEEEAGEYYTKEMSGKKKEVKLNRGHSGATVRRLQGKKSEHVKDNALVRPTSPTRTDNMQHTSDR